MKTPILSNRNRFWSTPISALGALAVYGMTCGLASGEPSTKNGGKNQPMDWAALSEHLRKIEPTFESNIEQVRSLHSELLILAEEVKELRDRAPLEHKENLTTFSNMVIDSMEDLQTSGMVTTIMCLFPPENSVTYTEAVATAAVAHMQSLGDTFMSVDHMLKLADVEGNPKPVVELKGRWYSLMAGKVIPVFIGQLARCRSVMGEAKYKSITSSTFAQLDPIDMGLHLMKGGRLRREGREWALDSR